VSSIKLRKNFLKSILLLFCKYNFMILQLIFDMNTK
jgi:hypothetical protein